MEKRGFHLNLSIADLRLEELEQRALQSNANGLSLRDWLALAEAWRIAHALREAGGNRSAAARALGIGRRTLYAKMEKLGLVQTWVLSRERRSAPSHPSRTDPPHAEEGRRESA